MENKFEHHGLSISTDEILLKNGISPENLKKLDNKRIIIKIEDSNDPSIGSSIETELKDYIICKSLYKIDSLSILVDGLLSNTNINIKDYEKV